MRHSQDEIEGLQRKRGFFIPKKNENVGDSELTIQPFVIPKEDDRLEDLTDDNISKE